MAYPTVSAPYGLRPVNLIGGLPFAGATRQLPIVYNYATNIFYGDFVSVLRGQIGRLAVTTAGGGAGLVGVFLGCSYTNPTTKQKIFSQYWPASTLAGDAMAYISDDPNALYKASIVTTQGGTTIGSLAPSLVGQNLTASDLAGNVNTGNSSNGLFWTTTTTTITYPLRLVDVVRDTATILGTAVYSSGTTTITTTANLTFAVPIGTDVSWLAANGQVVNTGSYVTTAIVANNTTSVVLSAAPLTTPSAAATLIFTQYPEGIVKLNSPGFHEYQTATAV